MHLSACCHTQLCAVCCLFSFARYRQAGRRKQAFSNGGLLYFPHGVVPAELCVDPTKVATRYVPLVVFSNSRESREEAVFFLRPHADGTLGLHRCQAPLLLTAQLACACYLLPLVWRMFGKPRRAIVHPTKTANDALCSFTRGCAVAQGE